MADVKGLLAKLEADEDQALREHEKLMKGIPLNPIAMLDAQQQIQQMMADPQADPDGDGQPDPPEVKMQMAQQMLRRRRRFSRFRLRTTRPTWTRMEATWNPVEFEKFPPDVQQQFHRPLVGYHADHDVDSSAA